MLEDKNDGPLTLIEKQDPTATKPTYEVEAYKACSAPMSPFRRRRKNERWQSCSRSKKSIRAKCREKDKASEQLTRVYIGVGTALQKQMEDLRAAGKPFEANRVAAAFAKFLDKINDQESEPNWPTARLAGPNVL